MLRGGGEGLLVAFLGDLDEEQAATAARMRHRTTAAVAFVLDAAAWSRGAEFGGTRELEERLRRLREAGWTALPVGPGASLAQLWRQADAQGATRADAGGPTIGGMTGSWA